MTQRRLDYAKVSLEVIIQMDWWVEQYPLSAKGQELFNELKALLIRFSAMAGEVDRRRGADRESDEWYDKQLSDRYDELQELVSFIASITIDRNLPFSQRAVRE